MREQNPITNEYPECWDDGSYHTGPAKPQKAQSALITGLLMGVIVLGGIASALGVMNVRLLKELTQQQSAVLPLSMNASAGEQIAVRRAEQYAIVDEGQALADILGFQVESVCNVCRRYWGLTEGLEVTAVVDDRTDLQAGDIILSLDGQSLTSVSQLYESVRQAQPGTRLKLEVLRSRQRFTMELTIANS